MGHRAISFAAGTLNSAAASSIAAIFVRRFDRAPARRLDGLVRPNFDLAGEHRRWPLLGLVFRDDQAWRPVPDGRRCDVGCRRCGIDRPRAMKELASWTVHSVNFGYEPRPQPSGLRFILRSRANGFGFNLERLHLFIQQFKRCFIKTVARMPYVSPHCECSPRASARAPKYSPERRGAVYPTMTTSSPP
jgi:hypothetical protein